MPENQKEIDPLCKAVKNVRLVYSESQEKFARRVELATQTISRFERGTVVPRGTRALARLLNAATKHTALQEEAALFALAFQGALDAACDTTCKGKLLPYSESEFKANIDAAVVRLGENGIGIEEAEKGTKTTALLKHIAITLVRALGEGDAALIFDALALLSFLRNEVEEYQLRRKRATN